MVTLRLPQKMEDKVIKIAELENSTKTDIIRKALLLYFQKYDKKNNPYELGKDLFGKYSLDRSDISKNYKKLLKEKLNEKFSH